MIKLPSSVKNVNFLGTQSNQPMTFYATTASGSSIVDPLGLNSVGSFGGFGQTFDNTEYIASTSYVTISGCTLNVTAERNFVCQLGWGGEFVNNGLLAYGANCEIGMFANNIQQTQAFTPGYIDASGLFSVIDHHQYVALFNVGAGQNTFNLKFKSTDSRSEAFCFASYIYILSLGS